MEDGLNGIQDRLGVSKGRTFDKGERRGRKPRRTLLSYFGGKGSGSGSSNVNFHENNDVKQLEFEINDKKDTDLDYHRTVEEHDDFGTHPVKYEDELQSVEKQNNNECGVVMIDVEQNEKPSVAISMKDEGSGLPMNNTLKCQSANPQLQEMIINKGGEMMLDCRKEEEYLLQHAGNPFFLTAKQKKKLAMLLDRQRIEADRQKTARSIASFKETHMHRSVAPLFERRPHRPSSIHKSTKRKAWTLLDFPTLVDNSIPIPTSEKNVVTAELRQIPPATHDKMPSLTRRRKRQQTPPRLDSHHYEVTRRGHPLPSVARELFGGCGDNNTWCLEEKSNVRWDLVGKDSAIALGMACGLSEESCASSIERYMEMRRRATTDSLWTEVYRPYITSDICGNSGCVESLLDWLDQCKARLMRRGSKPQPHCAAAPVEEREVRGRSNSDESLSWSTDGDEEDCGLLTATLLVGPIGVGKTTAVYACAAAAGFTIIEVNASCSRSGNAIRKMFSEATQSQRIGLAASSRKATMPSSSSSPPPPIIDMTDSTSDTSSVCHKKKTTTKPSGNVKRKGEDSSSGGGFYFCGSRSSIGNHHEDVTMNPDSDAAAGNVDDNNCDERGGGHVSPKSATSNLPKLTIILVEEIDVVTEDDAGFAAALKNLRADAKVPVIFTATSMASVNYIVDRHVSVLQMQKARICEVACVIASIAHVEGLALSSRACINLAQYFHLDLRRCVLALQGLGKNLMAACLEEDEGTGSIGGEARAAWIAFDSIQRTIDDDSGWFCCQLLPVMGPKDARHPRITHLDPTIVPCGGSSSHRIVVKGSGFLHPPIGVGDDFDDGRRMTMSATSFYVSPVSIICGHEIIPCNLISDSEIEAWVPARSIAGGVMITVLVGAGENASSKRQWVLRSDSSPLPYAVLCFQHSPGQQKSEQLQKERRKTSSKAGINSSHRLETESVPPPPRRRNRYVIESDEEEVDAMTRTAAGVDGERELRRVEEEETTLVTYDVGAAAAALARGVKICNVADSSMKPSEPHPFISQHGVVSDSSETEDMEEEAELDGTASSSDNTTTPPLSVISSTSSSQPQDVTGHEAKQQHSSLDDVTLLELKCTAAPPIRAESYPRPTEKQVEEFRLRGVELGECWDLLDSFSSSDIVLAGCTPQEDGNNFRVAVPDPTRLRYPRDDLSDAGEESCKDAGRDYGSPWPLVPSGPYIARDIWSQALNKSRRKDKKIEMKFTLAEKKRPSGGVVDEEEQKVLPCQLQSQCLLGRSLWFRRKNTADHLLNAMERLKKCRPSCSLYLTPEDCSGLLPTLYSLSSCSIFDRGVQLRHTRSRASREIEKSEAAETTRSYYLLHSNVAQTLQDVQFLQGMYSQEA